jgi:hypothetical protein
VAALLDAPLDANWLYTVTVLCVISAELEDERAAAQLYTLLLPYANRVVTVGRGCVCLGSASLPLGVLASVLGERAAAVAHLEEAVRRNDALGAVAFGAASRYALARVLDDPARVAELRREVETTTGAIGMRLPGGLIWFP